MVQFRDLFAKIVRECRQQRSKTVSITRKPMNIKAAIQYYEGLNDVGKAGFILTLKREDQKLFLDAYEEHYYRHDPENAPKVKISAHIFEDEKS